MAQRSVTREIPRLEFRALVSPDTLDEEKRTVDVIWTTGARVLRGYYDQFWEELSLDPKHVRMERLNGGAPLLDSHDGYSLDGVIGVVESARLEKGKGTATVRFAKAEDDPAAEKIFRKIKDGILRNVSVGYQINKMEKVSEETGKIPVYRAVDWTPHEISIVPIGADAGAGVRSDKQRMNPCVFIEERAMENDDTNTPTPVPSPAPAPAPAPISAEMRAQIEQAASRAATERILGIQRIGAKLRCPQADIDAAIANPAMTLDQFRAKAIDSMGEATPENGGPLTFERGNTQIMSGEDQRDKFIRASENWLIQRGGMAPMMQQAAQKRGEKLDIDPGPVRGRSLVEMARMCLERAGVRTDGMDVMDMVGKALTHRGASGNSTSDFPVILENTMHKAVTAGAATVQDTWRTWCKKGTVSDFRAHTRIRVGGMGVLADVAEGGEYKNADVKDAEKSTVSAGTKGRMVAISRQAIINDDMGVFNDIAARMGRAVGLTVEVGAFTFLLSNPLAGDGVALFHASHNNLTTGALSVASIEVDRVAMASQLDVGGNELLELKPSILLIPVGLGGEAKVINRSATDTDIIANKPSTKPNKVLGLYDTIIDTARLTGTARYSFADPNIEPVIEVVFLNGNEAPRMEIQNGWRTDGTEWKVSLDVGFGCVGYRGAIKSSGA